MGQLAHTLYGNGTPGLDERLRGTVAQLDGLIASVKELTATVRELVREREADEAAKEGSRRTLAQVRAIGLALLAVLGIGGGVGFSRLLAALELLAGP